MEALIRAVVRDVFIRAAGVVARASGNFYNIRRVATFDESTATPEMLLRLAQDLTVSFANSFFERRAAAVRSRDLEETFSEETRDSFAGCRAV